jgi:hypothetical protein
VRADRRADSDADRLRAEVPARARPAARRASAFIWSFVPVARTLPLRIAIACTIWRFAFCVAILPLKSTRSGGA